MKHSSQYWNRVALAVKSQNQTGETRHRELAGVRFSQAAGPQNPSKPGGSADLICNEARFVAAHALDLLTEIQRLLA